MVCHDCRFTTIPLDDHIDRSIYRFNIFFLYTAAITVCTVYISYIMNTKQEHPHACTYIPTFFKAASVQPDMHSAAYTYTHL